MEFFHTDFLLSGLCEVFSPVVRLQLTMSLRVAKSGDGISTCVLSVMRSLKTWSRCGLVFHCSPIFPLLISNLWRDTYIVYTNAVHPNFTADVASKEDLAQSITGICQPQNFFHILSWHSSVGKILLFFSYYGYSLMNSYFSVAYNSL